MSVNWQSIYRAFITYILCQLTLMCPENSYSYANETCACNNYGRHSVADITIHVTGIGEHINIKEQVPKYLNSQVKLITTRCIIIETEKIAKKTHGALTILKQFGTHECGHKDAISGANCILSMVGKKNPKHYIVATQDRDLQDKMRQKPGRPLLYLHKKSPTFEKPSPASYEKANKALDANPFITETQNEALNLMKEVFGVKGDEPKHVIKKKKLHNPNPMSCKRKKNKQGKKPEAKAGVSDGKVRKRKKKKLPKHLKEQLKSAAYA